MIYLNSTDPEFLILDVRENVEIEMADIPQRNEVKKKKTTKLKKKNKK